MAIYNTIHEKWYRTQEDIDQDIKSLAHEIEESNKDMHDNCDMNCCCACCPTEG